jgi:predicted nucleotidyltransferase component of viral defense system
MMTTDLLPIRRIMTQPHRDEEVQMLRSEVEMLMTERQRLLRATGAAAVFVAHLDSQGLPEAAYESADILAHSLNELSEDTLKDALESVRPQFSEGALGVEND